MPEARRSERLRSLCRARIIFNGGNSTIECLIRNVSGHGMRLELAENLSIPGEFDLEVPHKGRTYRTRLVWRGAGMIGVAYVPPSAEPIRADSELQRLEQENAELRARLRQLTERLQELGQLSSTAAA
ncbi:MAG: PilZ domain-containing protein [Methylobacteriaceae bacterium]|nr:PilZ domain-containing protein [Methylobacteriaceae bacterium]